MRVARLTILGVLCLLSASSPAAGHDPLGRAQPSVDTSVKGSGLARVIGFRVRDLDSGNPILAASLFAQARGPDGTVVPGTVTRVTPELFRYTVDLPRPGRWHVDVRIDGSRVVPTAFSFDVDAVGRPREGGASGGSDVSVWAAAGGAAAAAAAIVAVVLVVRRRRRRPEG